MTSRGMCWGPPFCRKTCGNTDILCWVSWNMIPPYFVRDMEWIFHERLHTHQNTTTAAIWSKLQVKRPFGKCQRLHVFCLTCWIDFILICISDQFNVNNMSTRRFNFSMPIRPRHSAIAKGRAAFSAPINLGLQNTQFSQFSICFCGTLFGAAFTAFSIFYWLLTLED